MTIEHSIQQIDETGVAVNVLSDYQVHTISLVGKGALGRNITKLKSNEEFIETEEGRAIMSKIEKAKTLDAEEANEPKIEVEDITEVEKAKAVEEITKEVVDTVAEGDLEDTSEETDTTSPVEEESPLEEAVAPLDEESVPVEKAKAKKEEEEEDTKSNIDPEDDEDAEKKIKSEDEDKKVEKQKMYSMDEYLEASKSALDGISKLVKEIKVKAPEAESWEVFDVIYDTIYTVDVATWYDDTATWNKVWDKVWDEVNTRTSKAKSLKVAGEATLDDKLKALEVSDPALAALFRENSQKALHAVQEREAVIRAKAREEGAEKYKRISSEECTTNQITDTMMDLEVSSPASYSVISKALDNASVITSAGELFRDIGSTDAANTLSADDYVSVKSKALASKADEKGESYNMAALRATVRQSDEYVATYA